MARGRLDVRRLGPRARTLARQPRSPAPRRLDTVECGAQPRHHIPSRVRGVRRLPLTEPRGRRRCSLLNARPARAGRVRTTRSPRAAQVRAARGCTPRVRQRRAEHLAGQVEAARVAGDGRRRRRRDSSNDHRPASPLHLLPVLR